MRDLISREYWRELFKQPAVRWNFIYILILTILSLALGFYINWLLGIAILVVALFGSQFSISRLRTIVVDAHEYLADLTYRVEQGQQEALLEMPLGMILMNKLGEIQWINPYMAKYFDLKIVVGKKLKEVDNELAKLENEHRNDKRPTIVTWQDRQFEFLVQKDNHVIYMMDVTSYEEINKRYKQQQIFLGNIYLDNYIELTKGMSDSDVSNLHNYVTSEISKWAAENHLLMKVIDDDNYLIIGHQVSLNRLEEKKFKILDIIRENTSKQNSPVTLSVGIAYGENDLVKLADTAQNNLDLALGRGGDQVVVRAQDSEARFYG